MTREERIEMLEENFELFSKKFKNSLIKLDNNIKISFFDIFTNKTSILFIKFYNDYNNSSYNIRIYKNGENISIYDNNIDFVNGGTGYLTEFNLNGKSFEDVVGDWILRHLKHINLLWFSKIDFINNDSNLISTIKIRDKTILEN